MAIGTTTCWGWSMTSLRSQAGYQAKQMNTLINIKTAEKTLQFGPSKCKSMFVGKSSNVLLNSDLHVDSWKVSYEDNIETGDLDLIETYEGPEKDEQDDSTEISWLCVV